MINNDSSVAELHFIKRALLSHLLNVSQIIDHPKPTFTGINLNQEYSKTTNLLDDIQILINRKEVASK
jgi:hypothetical protein